MCMPLFKLLLWFYIITYACISCNLRKSSSQLKRAQDPYNSTDNIKNSLWVTKKAKGSYSNMIIDTIDVLLSNNKYHTGFIKEKNYWTRHAKIPHWPIILGGIQDRWQLTRKNIPTWQYCLEHSKECTSKFHMLCMQHNMNGKTTQQLLNNNVNLLSPLEKLKIINSRQSTISSSDLEPACTEEGDYQWWEAYTDTEFFVNALFLESPKHIVNEANVKLYPLDISALLYLAVENVITQEGDIGRQFIIEQYKKEKEAEWARSDINPSSFLIILINLYGNSSQQKDYKVIVDSIPGKQTWYQLITSYKLLSLQQINRSEVEIIYKSKENKYSSQDFKRKFFIAPKANNFYSFSLDVSFTNGFTEIYEGILELNRNKLIGGEWISEKYPDNAKFFKFNDKIKNELLREIKSDRELAKILELYQKSI